MANARVLNNLQLQAITHGEGPLLIIAGAGTGKTTVITERIKYLITEKKVLPSEILALTFTEKAALEMEERVDIALPYGYSQMWVSTFHAFCDRILRSEAISIGHNPAYVLMTEPETILFLRKNIFKFKLDYFRPLGNPSKFLEGLTQHFNRLRDEDLSPSQYLDWAQTLASIPVSTRSIRGGRRSGQNLDENEIKKNLELAYAYQVYQDLKVKEGMMDFADLITNTLKLFRERPNILQSYQEKFSYILLDEFQDTNYAQNQLAILLSSKTKNITVVGDDDQAIYRWRGAAVSNMIQFRITFPNAKLISLTQNYRSSQEILDASYTLIQNNNPNRLEVQEHIQKKIQTQRKVKNSKVEFLFTKRIEDEAESVAKKIKELTTPNTLYPKPYEYKDIAILVRANDHAQSFVRTFSKKGIPYQFLGPGKLFHQEEIKDLIAYLKVLYNFEDSTSLYRLLTLPVFGLQGRDIAGCLNIARRKNITLFETLEYCITNQTETFLEDSVLNKIKILVEMIKRHLEKVPKDSAGQILYYFLQDSGMLNNFLKPQNTDDEKKYQNIARFFDKLKSYESEHLDSSVFAIVDWIDLSMQMGESPLAADSDWTQNNAVNILSVHSSKGLEFSVVFLVNLVAQRFPVRERREQIPIPDELIKEILPSGDFHLQEERRLFYVGMTRSRDLLYLTASHFYGEGKRERKISPFIYETLGKNEVDGNMKKEENKEMIFQPSLLDWAAQTPPVSTQLLHPTPYTLHPINYISYSQLQTFAMCPLHYKLQYILKLPFAQTAPLSFGTTVHAVLRDFYSSFLKGETAPLESIQDILKTQWIDKGYQSKQHKEEAYEKALYITTRYLKTYFDPKNAKPLAVEAPFQFFIKNTKRPQGLKVAGRIDRVDSLDENKIEIIDYKTGSNIPDEKELAKNLQLTMYGLAALSSKLPPFNKKPEEIVLSLYYLEEDVKLSTTRTLEQLEEAKDLILEKVEEIERSDFSCSSNIICQQCEYKMLCRV